MIGPILCYLGLHREAAQDRRRFEIVNAQRRTIVGWLDRRTVCSRCGEPLSDWKNLRFDDFSDADFSRELLSQLAQDGEAIAEYPPKCTHKA